MQPRRAYALRRGAAYAHRCDTLKIKVVKKHGKKLDKVALHARKKPGFSGASKCGGAIRPIVAFAFDGFVDAIFVGVSVRHQPIPMHS